MLGKITTAAAVAALSMTVCVLAVFAALVCCAAPSGVVSDVEVRPFEWPEVDHTKPFVVKLICETIRDMGLEFRIDPREGRAQYAATGRDGKAARQRTAREMLQSLKPAERTYAKMSALRAPFCAGSYAIEKIRGLDRPFGVRLAAWYDVKSNATVFDAEIAGRRTMVCRRPGRWKFVSAGSR